MERIRQIVNQQKSRCLDVESSPSNGLNANGLIINGDHNTVESSNTSVIRKVIEGTAPSAYPGFCLVTGDQENILSNNKSDTKAQLLRHLHDTCPKNPCVRHISAKIDCSRQDNSQRDLVPNNAHSRRQGQELIHKYLDVVSSESVDKQADVKKQCVQPVDTKHIGFECFTSMNNQLAASNPDQSEPINNHNNDKNLNANKNERLVSSTAAPLMASKSRKGIFRPQVTKNAITKCTDSQTVAQDYCSHHAVGCSTPRAHLKALVQQQREARRLERQRQIEAQKEEQARIQRNLQATAQAAAAAAKLPVTSGRKVAEPTKAGTESTTLQQMMVSVPPLNSYSSEREQKLEQLLRRELFPREHQKDESGLPTHLDRDPILRLNNGQDFIAARKSVGNSMPRTSLANALPSHQYCKKRNSLVILHKPDSAPRSPKYGKLNSDSGPKTNGCKTDFDSSCLVAVERQHHHHNHHHHHQYQQQQQQQHQQQDDRRWHEMNSHFGTVTLSSAVDNLLASGDHSSRLCGTEVPKTAVSCQQDIEVQVSAAPVSYSQVEDNGLSSLTGIRDRVTQHHSGTRKRLSAHKEPNVSCSNRSRTAICDHATEAARLDIKLSTQRVKHMIVDSDNDDDEYSGDDDFCDMNADNNGNSSLSSSSLSSYYEVIKKPSFNCWRRLEAVGASESELDEDNVCIVEDIKDDLIAQPRTSLEPPRTSFRYAATAADHLHTAGVNSFVKNECARKEFWNHIYADPLRFVSVHKRQQKLLHIENKSHLQSSSSGFQTKHSKRRTTGISYAKSGAKINSAPVHDVSNGNHNVASNTSTTINSQVVTVECTESSKEHGIKSHKIYSIKTKAHEFITEEKDSSSQSDPHRQSSESSLPKNYLCNGVVNSSSQPRLPPAALNLQLTAEMNYLETLASSMQHIADMESLRHITAAQAECVSLAQLLKARELQLSSKAANDQVSEKETQVSGTLLNNPGANNLISSAHSPQFQGVLKAAEEFDKIERRLSVKTSHLNSLSSSRSTATESPSIRTNISDQTSVHKSSTANNATLSDASSYDDDDDEGGDMTKSDTTTKQESSSMESSQKRNSNTDDAKSTLASVITASDSSCDSYHPSTGTGVVSVNGRSTTTPPSSKGIASSNVVKKHESGHQEIAQMVDSRRECNKIDDASRSKKLNNNNNDNDEGHSTRRKSKRSMQHNERSRGGKPISIPTLNLYSASLDDSCQRERSEEFNQVKYVLNKRVAALQSRRKKAEELLALSKNLELEEAEVVRLEREALSAIQSKRSTLRTSRFTEFSHSSSNNSSKKSGKCSKSAQWSKTTGDSKYNNNYNRRGSTTHSTVKQSSNYTPYTDDVKLSSSQGLKDEQIYEAFPTASLGKSASVSVGGSQINVNTASDSSSARTISSATDIKYCKSDSDSSRSAAAASHSTRFNSHRSIDMLHQSKSAQQNEVPLANLSIDNDDIGRGSKSTGNSISKVDNAVETTPTLRRLLPCEIGSPLDRTMTPSSRHLRQRSNSHDSGRRKRVTVPNSTDSLDDEGRMYVSGVGGGGADDEPFSTMSANSHSDLSELESRIQALNSNLKKQEGILSRINLEYKRVHKDRLARLESTLLKHKQLCTEIIANIKADLDVCKASICNESGDYSHSKSINNLAITTNTTTVDNLSGISPSKSLNNNLTLGDNSNENNISCSLQILDKIPTSSHTIPDDVDERFTPTATPTPTKDEETEPDTLISVAEELVSPQDTDDELNQLDLDDDDDDVGDGDDSSRKTPVAGQASTSSSPDENKTISPLPNANVSISNEENKQQQQQEIVNCEVLKPPSSVSLSISPHPPLPPSPLPTTTDTFCTDVQQATSQVSDSKSISHNTDNDDHNEEVKSNNVSFIKYPTESLLIFDDVKVDDVDVDGAFQAKHAAATIEQTTTSQDEFANLLQKHNLSPSSRICSEIVDNNKSQSTLDVVAHNASECIEMSTTTVPLSPSSVNGIIHEDGGKIPAVLTTTTDNNHDDDYNRMVVSLSSVSVTPPAYTPEVKTTTSLLQIAAEHRRREEVVDRITSELLMQLVSEAIRSTLNVRMSNAETKTSDDSESDKENNIVEDEFPQQKSPVFNDDDDDEESSDDEESVRLLDLGVKLSDEDFDEKISEAAKSKIHVTPEPSYSEESVQGLFADIPERSQALIQLAVRHFWDYRSNAEMGYKEASLTEALSNPPTEFGFDYCDKIDLEIFKTKSNIRFISSTLLFDLIGELLQKIYAGEDSEVRLLQVNEHAHNVNHFQAKSSTHRVSSAQFRLWRGPCRPTNYNHLLNIVTSEICRELNLKTDAVMFNIHQQQQQQEGEEMNKSKRIGGGRQLNEITSSLASSSSRFSRLVQWTLGKKSWLDRILDLELRLDEPTWLSYVPEEREIKVKLADELWEDVLNDAVCSVIALNSCKS
ncbi:unnamed protein product [Trichobilharzia szidati]|nr:unnamed protein product [Trichobilharzia szidati]